MRSHLENQKTGLAKETNMENIVSHLANKQLHSFVEAEKLKNKVDKKMSDFMELNKNFNVQENLKDVCHQIALAKYNCNRVVDGGDFHILLENARPMQLDLIYEIPVVCKVNLDCSPPLFIKFVGKKNDKKANLSIFASYTDT